MDREQWGRFTDFGVTVLDSAGRQLAQGPLQYAFGRLSTPLPEGHGDVRARLSLYPGFADAGDEREWSVATTIRLYADSAITVPATEGTGELQLMPGARGVVRFRLPSTPWPLAEGFSPLAVVLVRGRRAGVDQGERVLEERAMSERVVRIAAGQGFWGDWLGGAGATGARRSDRLSDDGLPRRSDDVHHAEAEVAGSARPATRATSFR